jgi:ribosome-binding protein aMBF1 (putative translation factor)
VGRAFLPARRDTMHPEPSKRVFIISDTFAPMDKRSESPVGTSAAGAAQRRRKTGAAYRAAEQDAAPYEAIARFVIMRRAELGLTQAELARKVGTSHSAISRLESGQHRPGVATLERVAHALGARFVMEFETDDLTAPTQRAG